MSGVVIISPPPPPPPPPPVERLPGQSLEAWYWAEGYRRGYLAARAGSPLVAVKRWWKSRMLWLGSSAIVGGIVLDVLAAERQMALQAFGKYGPAIIIGLGVAVNLLRWKTTTGVSK